MVANGLTVYERIPDPIEAVKVLGTAIAKSRMFGCESVEQGQVLALECLARGMPPLTLAERFHFVQGKLMMRYDAMLAEFHALGGKHKIISRTDERAEIELSIDGESHNESLTWDQARGEKWPFAKDGKTIKDNWATPRARRQMLWARVVSEGVRALRPGVNNGRYVTEEIEIDNEPPARQPISTVVESEVVTAKAPQQPQPQQPAAETTSSEPAYCDSATAKRIIELYLLLGVTHEQQEAALARRKVSSLRNLTAEQAAEILAKLETKAAVNQVVAEVEAGEMAGKSQADDQTAGTVTTPASPCTQAQIDRVKSLLAEYAQTDRDFNNKLKARLVETGKQKIADLSTRDCDKLIDLVTRKQAEEFFRLDLEVYAAVKADERAAEQVANDAAADAAGAEGVESSSKN